MHKIKTTTLASRQFVFSPRAELAARVSPAPSVSVTSLSNDVPPHHLRHRPPAVRLAAHAAPPVRRPGRLFLGRR